MKKLFLSFGIFLVVLESAWLASRTHKEMKTLPLQLQAENSLVQFLETDHSLEFVENLKRDRIILWPEQGFRFQKENIDLVNNLHKVIENLWEDYKELSSDEKRIISSMLENIESDVRKLIYNSDYITFSKLENFANQSPYEKLFHVKQNVRFHRYKWKNYDKSLFYILVFYPQENVFKLYFSSVSDIADKSSMLNALLLPTISLILTSLSLLGFALYSYIKHERETRFQLATDIIKLKEAEKKLSELNATKDKFFSILSHDLRNPFGAIIGLSDILLESLDKLTIEESRRIIKLINDSGKNTYKLLENLLEWSRTQTGKIDFQPQNVKLKNIINEVFYTTDNQAKAKEISLQIKVDDETMVLADPNMLSTVLRNFVSNAIKFTPKKGEVVINVEQENQKVKISVSDTGVGIDKNKLTKLFNISEKVSSTGTEKETGTGIGLLLCKELIEKHGSEIHVESELKNGSVFSFYLPDFGEKI